RPSSYTGTLPEPHVLRTFAYDSAGRRLSSDDPDTDDLTNGSQASNSWRYLFNRVGDLVAVRDPRGCGQNFFYDFGGRLVGEQYVSCPEAQSALAEWPHEDNTRVGRGRVHRAASLRALARPGRRRRQLASVGGRPVPRSPR